MNKKLEWLIIIFLLVILVGLSSCAKPKLADQPSQPTLTETIANIGSTGKVIGCVFAPWHADCQKIKEDKKPHQTQREYTDEITKEFEQVDKDAQTKNQ